MIWQFQASPSQAKKSDHHESPGVAKMFHCGKTSTRLMAANSVQSKGFDMSDLTVSDVGVERFNKDHQRLLFYIEEFARLSARFRLRTPFPDEWDQMDSIFLRLEKYTRIHFKEEEREMAKRGYPALPDHHAQHQQLISVLADLKIKVRKREFQAIGAIKLFLQEWIINHINHIDTQYGSYFKTEMPRFTPPGSSGLLNQSNRI